MSFIAGGQTLYVASPTKETSPHIGQEFYGSIILFGTVPSGIIDDIFDPFANPLLPIHITQVVPGIQIRVSLKGGFHMIPKQTKNGDFLVPGTQRSRRRGYEKSVLIGTVTANNPPSGQLSMTVSDEVYGRVYRADVPYRFMAIAQRVVANTELVESATRPGGVALGTRLAGGRLLNPRAKLVHIKF
jgi:hypothetical protein